MSQADALRVHLNTIPDPIVGTPANRALSELLYTAGETGLLDYSVSQMDAVTIWKLMQLAMSFGDDLPPQLRM